MFSDELKTATVRAHTELERVMIPLLKKVRTRVDYITLLRYLAAYFEPLEQQLLPYFSPANFVSHAYNIRKDIADLEGQDLPEFDPATILPVIDSFPKAIGVRYVLEGSTLGGQIITKMLAKQLGMDGSTGFTYYNPYQDQTMIKWQEFKDFINSSFTAAEQASIIDGANNTFLTLNQWISTYERTGNGEI